MAEAAQGGAERIPRYSRDLLRQFSGEVRPEDPRTAASAATEEDSGEIELSLGLSLGGCFGVDPAHKKGLQRSSSIAAILFPQQREEDPAAVPPLKRTSSLPAGTEEEQRKRKELQCLRRMEAKRKKSEKTNGYLAAGAGEDTPQEWGGGPGWRGLAQFGGPPPNGVAAAARHVWAGTAAGRAVDGKRCFSAAVSQGSVGSQGSNSSVMSDFDSRPPKQEELWGNGTESSKLPRMQSLPDLTDHISSKSPTVGKPLNCGAGTEGEVGEGGMPKKPSAVVGGGNGIRMREMMEEMPWVSTRGDGPNGRRVEGFLYRYGKGEEVRIVCVCHGRFLSPAEFVRHGGGGDVAHPLRHIIVNPSPSGLL